GWSIFTSSIGKEVPCVSTLTSPLAAPSATGLRKRAPVSVIVTTQLYTLKYAMKPKKASLSVGAKAGIAVGVILTFIFGALLVAFVMHKRRLRNHRLTEGKLIGGESYYGSQRSRTYSRSSHPAHMSERQGSAATPQGIPVAGGFWIPPPAPEPPPTTPPPPIPIQELPASTYMHEHHPAFQSSEDAPEPPLVQVLNSPEEPQIPAALVSPLVPLEAPSRN
ncbi:MAG: hypothetical protein Q9201_006714, partial [Fulgogasparrea decipioides]